MGHQWRLPRPAVHRVAFHGKEIFLTPFAAAPMLKSVADKISRNFYAIPVFNAPV